MNDPAGNAWASMLGPGMIEPDLIGTCRSDGKCVGALIASWKRAGPDDKKESLPKFVRLGGQLSGKGEDGSDRIGPFLIDESIVELMVGAIGDKDPGIRDQAVEILAKETPDSLVRKHATEIESTLKRFPETVNGILLLGKLGREKALRRITKAGVPKRANPFAIHAALGKLGIKSSEDFLLAEYQRESDQERKRELAWFLGYMATPKGLEALVRDLRTPSYYLWSGGNGRRSFRVHIIQALSMAFPGEPILWTSFYDKPANDRFYDGVEGWAVRNFRAKWEQPRPPFLWEDIAPYPLPGWKDRPFTSGQP